MKRKNEKEKIISGNNSPPLKIKLKNADNNSNFSENIVNTVREPLIVLDQDLKIVTASRSFYNVFKVKPDETLGMLIYDLGNGQWDIPKLKELLETILPEKTSFENYEVEHYFSTIGKRIMLLNARQIKTAFGKEKIILLAIEDITERRLAEKKLSEKNRLTSEYLNILMDHAHAPIIIWDSSMLIKRFNLEFEKLSGYKYAEVFDKNIEILFPKNKIVSTLKLIKNNLDVDNQEVIEIDILTKDKDIRTVLWNSANILDEEGEKKVATIAQDITKRKQTEENLSRSEIRYRRLFESAKDGILILDAETGEIIDVNPFLVELFGYSKKIFLKKKIWEIGFFKDIAANKNKFLELKQREFVRFDNLILESSTGQKINVEFVSNFYSANSQKIIQCNIRDITQRIQTKNRHALTSTILSILNRKNDWPLLVKNILEVIKKYVAFEAIGIRLKEGEDYPYIETIGFSPDFIDKEHFLYTRDPDGKIICDTDGKPKFECICGSIISGRTKPLIPFFTNGGSFWTNSKTQLLASTLAKDYPLNNCSSCDFKKNESVALIPIYSGDEIIGLLQLTDKQPGKLTLDLVQFLEGIGSTIGIAFKRVTIEKQIKESEEKFRHSFEYAPTSISLVGLDKKFQRINNAFRLMLGYDENEIKELTFSDITHPDDLLIGSLLYDKLIAGDINKITFEKRYIRKDKKIIWVIVSTTLMLDNDNKPQYFITQIVDITERKKSEEQITMLAHSLRSINECVSITDLDDNLIFVNDAFVNMYGYSESELIGNKMSIVRSSNNSPDIVNAILTDTLKGGWSGELWNTRKDGSEFQISLSTTLVKDKTNKVLGLIGIATDITDRKRKELELIGAKEKAEEMNKLKTSFLANMSHELRTPLIGILGYAEFLENDLKDKDQIEMANTIKTSGLRLTTTLNNILDISRIESEKGKMDLKEQDLIKFLTEQIRLFTEPAAEKGLNLTFETKEVHLKAFIDSEMFISTISNLLNNAIKFTQSGKVTLRAMKQENHAVIEVEDTGIGVPVALQEIIFDPFRQASEGHTRSFEGTGLGLAIVKKYMFLMGGNITLSSRLEDPAAGIAGGSTFILKFPLTGHIVENIINTHWV